jgi:hypothetical protein
MCALCGILAGKGHWSDSAAALAVFADRTKPHTRARERQARTRLLNAVLKYHGIVVKDWSGSSYLLTNLTGRSAIVDTIADVWPAAERLAGRTIDPLDEQYLTTLTKPN